MLQTIPIFHSYIKIMFPLSLSFFYLEAIHVRISKIGNRNAYSISHGVKQKLQHKNTSGISSGFPKRGLPGTQPGPLKSSESWKKIKKQNVDIENQIVEENIVGYL